MLVGGAAGVQVRDPVDTMREGQIHGRIRDKKTSPAQLNVSG